MAETIVVKAGTGRKVRLSPRQVLSGDQTLTVVLSVFVRRLLANGDLVEVTTATSPPSVSSVSTTSSGSK